MTRSLAWKLTLAFLLVALTVALLVALFIRLFNANQLDRLVVEQQRSEFRALLVNYYQAVGSWEGIHSYLGPAAHGEAFPRPVDRRARREFFGLVDARGVVLIPLLPEYPIGARVAPEVLARGEPVEVDGRVVGTILTPQRRFDLSPEEAAFLARTNSALLIAGAGAVLIALVVGVWLARTLTQPLRALTQATHRMAGGELEQAVTVTSQDELGELAAAFNQMSREVARANNARRQMTADVAHELRTPLTVIAGYIEAMRDGDLAPTSERLSVIYAEIERLQHLVGELRTLTQADAGELKLNREATDPVELLQHTAALFEHQAAQKGVRLEWKAEAGLPFVQVDEARMAQVLRNLLSNALRYTPAGGVITLEAARSGNGVRLMVRDTGQGIQAEDLPLIFERFYRADKSRTEDGAESGLGLAIAKAIVEAHGGRLEAHSEGKGRGSLFVVDLA